VKSAVFLLILIYATSTVAHPRHDHAAGRCAVERAPEQAENILRAAIERNRWDRVRELLNRNEGCAVGETVSIDPHIAAGGMAERLTEAGRFPASAVDVSPADATLALENWNDISRCLMQHDRAAVALVLQSGVGTSDEREKLAALLTANARCMEPRLVRELAGPTQRHRFRAALAISRWASVVTEATQ
jgi:hypothetical protein